MSMGIDFSEEALRNHPNPYRVKADLRNIPLPDNYADHVVSYEPTPLHTGTSTIMDALMTLHELSRVGKNVHIIQRHGKIAPVWTYPFVQHYLAGLGVPYSVRDITDYVAVKYDTARQGQASSSCHQLQGQRRDGAQKHNDLGYKHILPLSENHSKEGKTNTGIRQRSPPLRVARTPKGIHGAVSAESEAATEVA